MDHSHMDHGDHMGHMPGMDHDMPAQCSMNVRLQPSFHISHISQRNANTYACRCCSHGTRLTCASYSVAGASRARSRSSSRCLRLYCSRRGTRLFARRRDGMRRMLRAWVRGGEMEVSCVNLFGIYVAWDTWCVECCVSGQSMLLAVSRLRDLTLFVCS